MRIYVVYVLVTAFCLYALRDWVVSLFALIVLTAFHEHEDMPHYLFQIRGVGPWNALFAAAFLGWLLERISLRRPVGLPKPMLVLVSAYLTLMTVSVIRGAADAASFVRFAKQMTASEFLSEYLINAVKYSLPALLLFDACRTRKRVIAAFVCISVLVLIDALLVIKRIPLSTLWGHTEVEVLRRRVNAVTGLHPNDMALMLVTALWSLVGFLPIFRARWKVVAFCSSIVILLALGLCYSRAGFAACLGVGLILGFVTSKRILLLLLIVVIPLGFLSPSVRHRALRGIVEDPAVERTVQGDEEDDPLTAGRRKHVWPIALRGIAQQPIIGYGRQATSRVLAKPLLEQYGSVPGHPHNAYFEVLLDMGIIGLIPVLGLLIYLIVASVRLARYKGDPLKRAVGASGLAAVAALMMMGISGQHFFPAENLFVFICVEGVMYRVYVDTFLQNRPPGVPSIAYGQARRQRSRGLKTS